MFVSYTLTCTLANTACSTHMYKELKPQDNSWISDFHAPYHTKDL